MFWKAIEFLIRTIHFKRFRQADKIAAAAAIAGEDGGARALEALDELSPKLHPSLRSLHALTRGRLLAAAGRVEEAERAFIESALADPSNAKAHLDLAVIAGRRFRFDDARARLEAMSRACTRATEVLTPQRVPIAPQDSTNLSSALSLIRFLCSVHLEYNAPLSRRQPAACPRTRTRHAPRSRPG